LLLANSKHYNSCSGLAPYSVMNMPDTQIKIPDVKVGDLI
jgi:hypothetical protein